MNSAHLADPPSGSTPWTTTECQAFDQALQTAGLAANMLLEQAARSISVFVEGLGNSGLIQTVSFLCGPGNNGADGVAAARQLLGSPCWKPSVVLPCGPPKPESLLALQVLSYRELGGDLSVGWDALEHHLQNPPDLWVDALFGLGLTRPILPPLADFMQRIATLEIPTLAVDCPTGLDCTSGNLLGPPLPATWTLSFVAPKQGFFCGSGPGICGEVHVAGIGVRSEIAAYWKDHGGRFPGTHEDA